MSSKHQEILNSAVLRILGPLIRVLIKHKMSHSEFSELARQAYVQQAVKHYGIDGRKTTHQRISVLTGLPRKDIARLRDVQESSAKETLKPNRAVSVINGWLRDPEFQTKTGPASLPIQGDKRSFSALVARYGGDITPRAVIDELVGAGVVTVLKSEKIKLKTVGYIPHADELQKVRVMSASVSDLLNTAANNIDAETEGTLFQRQFSHPGVPESVAEDFHQEVSARSLELLIQMQTYLNERIPKVQPKKNYAEPTHRVGLGIYGFDGIKTEVPDKSKEETDYET